VRLGDLSVGFVHTLADAIHSHGLDPQPLLLQYGLDPARLAEAGARLSSRATCAWATRPSN